VCVCVCVLCVFLLLGVLSRRHPHSMKNNIMRYPHFSIGQTTKTTMTNIIF
jgi:hypothetical protein